MNMLDLRLPSKSSAITLQDYLLPRIEPRNSSSELLPLPYPMVRGQTSSNENDQAPLISAEEEGRIGIMK